MNIGDAVLNITAKTESLDKEMNDLFDKIERTVNAARAAWNGDILRLEKCSDVIQRDRVETIYVRFKDGTNGKIRAYRDEEDNYRDRWTNELVTPISVRIYDTLKEAVQK